jgi:acyl carrier protein
MQLPPRVTSVPEHLEALTRPERRFALEELIVGEFKEALSMDEQEDFPPDASFFELGCTSLKLLEIARRLESLLGQPISTNKLFNNPTVDQLVEHIVFVLEQAQEHAPAIP